MTQGSHLRPRPGFAVARTRPGADDGRPPPRCRVQAPLSRPFTAALRGCCSARATPHGGPREWRARPDWNHGRRGGAERGHPPPRGPGTRPAPVCFRRREVWWCHDAGSRILQSRSNT